MRLALISDLHASLHALDTVLADIQRRGVDRVVCLGDVVDLGPEPIQTLDRLQERGIPIVRGNHDPLDEHPTMPLLASVEDWTRQALGPARLAHLADLPLERIEDLDGLQVLCVHASPRSLRDQILAETPVETLAAWWGDRSFDVLACGHTHVPLVRRISDRLVVNVGSVGQPFRFAFDGRPPQVLPWSEYAIIEHDRGQVGVEHRRLPLNLAVVERALWDSGFPHAERWLEQWTRS